MSGMNVMLMGASKDKEEKTATFNFTSAVQTWSVPSGVTEVEAYVFGPGGGADSQASGSEGGAGGFSTGTIDVSSGGSLKIIVGGAGAPGTQYNGSGGGYSGVFTSSWGGSNVSTDHAAAIIIAGGGGGAGDAAIDGGKGGAGGYPNGQDGDPGASRGRGGTQSSGGSYYGGGSGTGSCTATSCVGQTLRGGTGCGGAEGSGGVGWPNQIYGGTWGSAAGGNGCNAGGGGAGYYGGGGGGGGDPNGGCAGGGSGYIGGSGSYTVTNGAGYTGNYKTPPSQATSNTYYSSGISVGGDVGANVGNGNNAGGHGLVVLRWFE